MTSPAPRSTPLKDRFLSLPMIWGLGTLLLGLALTVVGWRVLVRQQREADHARIQRHAQRIQAGLRGRLRSYEDILRASRGLLDRSPDLDAAGWAAFVQGLQITERHAGLKTLVKVDRIRREDLSAFLQALRRQGREITLGEVRSLDPSDTGPKADHPECLIITLAEPAAQVSKALGMDLATSAHQREAAERSMLSGRATLTGPLRFRSEGGLHPALGFYLPLYRGGGTPPDDEARRERCIGWVSVGIYLEPLLEEVGRGGDEALTSELWERSEGRELRLHPVSGVPYAEAAMGAHIATLDLGERRWTLLSRPTPAFFRHPQRIRPTAALLTGILLSLSLAITARSVIGTRERARRLAEEFSRTSREALRRLETLLAEMPVGAVEWDHQLRIRRWNPAAERIFGFGEGEVLDRSGSRIRFPGGERDEVRVSLEEVLRERRGLTRTLTGRRKDGEPIVCEWTSTPLYGADGRVEGLFSLVLDVTEQRRSDERAWLHQKLESLGVMAGGIAHDFNNLLWAISGNAELARDRVPEDSPARLNLDRIEGAAFRAAALARQMLAYAGRAPFVTHALDLSRLLREMGGMVREALPPALTLLWDLEQDLPAIQADGAQLQQAVLNLLANAAEAMGPRGGEVRVRTFRLEVDEAMLRALVPGSALSAGSAVGLEVQDSGPGLEPGQLSRIFDPFYSTRATGRGLGLSAALGIVRAHRGGMAVESRAGQGATFRILLPLAGTPAESFPPMSLPTQPLPARGCVLLAEDETVLRELTAEALEPLGFEVIAVADGQEALERFEAARDRISVVVLDLSMPRMGGVEAFARLRELDPNLPVVLCSGYSDEDLGSLPGGLQPDAFLAKPYRLRELVAKVRELAAGKA